MLDVLTRDPVLTTPASTVPPHFSECPRVSLACGRVVAHALHLSAGVPAATAIELACTLARRNRMRISVPVGGPLHALPGLVATALSRAGVPADQIEVSIPTRALQDAGIEALLALSAMRDDGVDVALAGFGLDRLELITRLPLSGIILSPPAIRDVPGSCTAIAGLHDLLAMAADHALRVVATGIASETQRAVLSGLGADDGEGTLFGPMAAAPRRNLAEA